MAYAVGIDLGTTNTVVSAVRNGVATTLLDALGHRLIPSVVSFHPSGSTLVGHKALERRLVDASSTVYSVKRLMGRPWDAPEVQQSLAKLPFELREGATGGSVVVVRGESYSLPEISAFVLRHAKTVAESALGEPVERAVVTVPANFNDLQRAATKTAGRIAGLDVLRILNEPTAAALAYGPEKDRERIAVYDLGGGTFDFTLLDLAGNVFEVLATAGDTALGGDDIDVVLAERMADDLLAQFRFNARDQPGVFGHLRVLAEGMKRELSARDEHTVFADDLVPGDRGSRVVWRFRMKRPELEWASLALVERTFAVCQQAFDAAGINARDLDRVILVGGATRMPMVARKVEQFFGRPPIVRINPEEVVALGAAIQASLLDRTRRPTAAKPAHPRIAEDSVVRPLPMGEPPDTAALSLPLVTPGVFTGPGAGPPQFLPGAQSKVLVFDVPGLRAAPALDVASAKPPRKPPPPKAPGGAERAPSPTTMGFEGPPAVAPAAPLPPHRPRAPTMPYPFEVGSSAEAAPRPPPAASLPGPSLPGPSFPSPSLPVPSLPAPSLPAPSAIVQPPSLQAGPALPAPLLIDVTPLSLSVETVGGFCDVLIDANTPVPCDKTRSFATASDGQTAVRVRVSQGESKRFEENSCLGELELSGLVPAARGETQIAVTFEIDADGILNVRARDVKTGKEMVARLALLGVENSAEEIASLQARHAAHPAG